MIRYLAVFMLCCGLAAAFAGHACAEGVAGCRPPTLAEANAILADVGTVKRIEASPVDGLWLLELEKDGRKGVVFMDCARKNLIAGTIFPITWEMSARANAAPYARRERVDVAALTLKDSIVLGNPNGARRIFVFTDPDCPFCRKLHGELKRLAALEPDLAIYVKMFPLSIHPAAYDRARAILAAGTSDALDRAFGGLPLPPVQPGEGRSAVDETVKLAASLGITATPALVLPDGRLITGFRDADAIMKLLSTL